MGENEKEGDVNAMDGIASNHSTTMLTDGALPQDVTELDTEAYPKKPSKKDGANSTSQRSAVSRKESVGDMPERH
jgi:hypothetical protein